MAPITCLRMPAFITVKKPDGTTEKISMEEFLARQKKSAPPVQSVASAPAPTPSAPRGDRTILAQPSQPLSVSLEDEMVQPETAPPFPPMPAPVLSSQPEEMHTSEIEKAREAIMRMSDTSVATATPFNAFKHDADVSMGPPATPPAPPAAVPPLKPSLLAEEPSEEEALSPPPPLTNFSSRRPIMNDVVAAPRSIGPIEEIQAITLVDFRRLSPVERDAAMRLEQKFNNLKAESILLFWQARAAWKESELYHVLTTPFLSALLRREPLNRFLGKEKGITMAEVIALLDMERRLIHD